MKFLNKNLVNLCENWGADNLKPTLQQREEEAQFNLQNWTSAQSLKLNEVLTGADTKKEVTALASMFYGLARGSMDLPFCSSLAAHSVIAIDLFNTFATKNQKNKYDALMRSTDSIAAICNSETGAGTDLKKMTASAVVSEDGTALVNLVKPCATNASHANLLLCSVWEKAANKKDALSILILEKSEVQTTSLQHTLAGFKTGITGSVKAQNLRLNYSERVLQTNVGNSNVFKRCFDMERLFLGIMVAGILDGVESNMLSLVEQNETNGFTLQDKQYLQQKLLHVYTVKTNLNLLIESILNSDKFDLNEFSKELCLIKILLNTDAVNAITSYYEFIGHKGFMANHICQKLNRDFMGLKYFGGTTELQKNNLFAELVRPLKKRNIKLVAS